MIDSNDEIWLCYQIGGGSLRIYKREVQQKVLEIVGISPEQVRRLLCTLHLGFMKFTTFICYMM